MIHLMEFKWAWTFLCIPNGPTCAITNSINQLVTVMANQIIDYITNWNPFHSAAPEKIDF